MWAISAPGPEKREITFSNSHIVLPSSYITHNATEGLNGNLSDYTQFPPEPKKRLHAIVFTYSVEIPKTRKHNVRCKIGGVAL